MKVNGQVSSTGYFIKEGDKIEIFKEEVLNSKLYELNLDVIFEDEYCAVINKIAGIPVHSHGHRNIVNALLFNVHISKTKDHLIQPLPVHRLDAQTSGLLIIAKSRKFQVEIGKMLENRNVSKSYTAIVCGKLEGSGFFNDAIDGKDSLSKYECLKTKKDRRFEYLSLLHLNPVSGRTHQLRIHCATAGHPILGEQLYNTEIPNLKGKGLFLCATHLAFGHPITKEEIKLKIEPPKKFTAFFSIDYFK